MGYYFISYNRHSKAAAKNLAEDIKNLGHDIWLDEELTGGQVWWDQILERIRECNVFVFVLDPASLNSQACTLEYCYAADLGKPILPVLVSEGVSINLLPSALSQIQIVDYRNPDRQAVFCLARAIDSVPTAPPLPDPLPPPPDVPISYLGSLAQKVDASTFLKYEDQAAILIGLKKGLQESETEKDARVLLQRLRKRHDLFAIFSEEIDELLLSGLKQPHAEVKEALTGIKSVSSKPEEKPEEKLQAVKKSDSHRPTIVNNASKKRTIHYKMKYAVIGAVSGYFIISIIDGFRSGFYFDLLEGGVLFNLFNSLLVAVSGIISKTPGLIIALFCAAVGHSISPFTGGPIGALIGVIIASQNSKIVQKSDRAKSSIVYAFVGLLCGVFGVELAADQSDYVVHFKQYMFIYSTIIGAITGMITGTDRILFNGVIIGMALSFFLIGPITFGWIYNHSSFFDFDDRFHFILSFWVPTGAILGVLSAIILRTIFRKHPVKKSA